MTYIKLEDAKTLASELSGIPVNFLHKFDSLPTINPESMIEEMINEEQKVFNQYGIEECKRVIIILQQLLKKFKS